MSTPARRVIVGTACSLGLIFGSLVAVAEMARPSSGGAVGLQGPTAKRERTLLVDPLGPLDAVEIAVVLYDGRYIAPTKPTESDMNLLIANGTAPAGSPPPVAYKFQAGDDWLKNLSIVVRNRTEDRIARIWIQQCFPETGATGEMVCRDVAFGPMPANAPCHEKERTVPPGVQRPLNLGRADEKVFPLGDSLGSIVKLVNERQPFSEITLCQVHVGVNFEHGMRWWQGRYAWPVCGLPGQFNTLPLDYFPGFMPGANGH